MASYSELKHSKSAYSWGLSLNSLKLWISEAIQNIFSHISVGNERVPLDLTLESSFGGKYGLKGSDILTHKGWWDPRYTKGVRVMSVVRAS